MLKILNFFSTKKAAAASPAVDTHQNSISRSSQQTIDGAVTYALVVNAEIRWALKCVMADYPNNSNRAMSNLFPVNFPDSPTTAKYQVGPTSCVIQLTLVWVLFKGKLMNDIQNSNYYSLSFDESLNRVTSKLRNGPHRQIPDH